MRREARGPIQLEWFNVTYRSALTSVSLLVTLAVVGLGGWYYFFVQGPKTHAAAAIARAELRLEEASGLKGDERIQEILERADAALREAKEGYRYQRYDDARVAAIRSDNWSLQAIHTVRGEGEGEEFVRFTRTEGDVRVKRSGEFSWGPANDQMALNVGDQVKTSSSASAQLLYFDGTITTIQPGSLLEIRELFEDPVTKVRRVAEKLNWGELNATTQKRNVSGSYHEVATAKSSARAEDSGEFRIRFDREKKTGTFDVFQGRIEVDSAGKRESVVAGESIRATSRGKLSAKQVLPPAPRLISPRDQRVFISENPEDREITLNWEDIPGAASYHLVISDRSLFTDPLYDASRQAASAILDGVPESSYYWKVAAVSSTGVEGPFAEPRRFRVSSQKIRDRSDSEPPVLEITEFVPVGMMVIVNGRTEPGASLWVDTEKIDVHDDGTFYAVVRLRREGVNPLRFVAQDTAGNETVVQRAAHVELF